MMKQVIAVVLIIIMGIILERYLMKRVESDFRQLNRPTKMMYVTDSVHVRIADNDSADILFTLFSGDSVLISDYNQAWKEVQSGGFVSYAELFDSDR